MSKNILVISYSQTGQLTHLTEQFLLPLQHNEQISIEHCIIEPREPYPFPWKFIPFFNQFPESVHLQPAPIIPPKLQREKYDLVIIAYTVWFLSPAQPITAFLQSDQANVLKDTPVITLIGCRNMWLMAQEKMKKMIAEKGGKLIGNVVKVDQSNAWESFITTPAWMLTGIFHGCRVRALVMLKCRICNALARNYRKFYLKINRLMPRYFKIWGR